MNYRLTKVTAIIMAAGAFLIVPGIYVLTSDAATKLMTSFGTTQAASRSNRVAAETETFKDVVQLGGVESVKDDLRVR